MVQIGNFHIGRYDTVQSPTLTVGEAYSLWDNLVARYDWEDTLAIFYNYAHDSELQDLLKREITKFETDSGVVKDDFIFRRFFQDSKIFYRFVQ